MITDDAFLRAFMSHQHHMWNCRTQKNHISLIVVYNSPANAQHFSFFFFACSDAAHWFRPVRQENNMCTRDIEDSRKIFTMCLPFSRSRRHVCVLLFLLSYSSVVAVVVVVAATLLFFCLSPCCWDTEEIDLLVVVNHTTYSMVILIIINILFAPQCTRPLHQNTWSTLVEV